jgi:hypothetical protein
LQHYHQQWCHGLFAGSRPWDFFIHHEGQQIVHNTCDTTKWVRGILLKKNNDSHHWFNLKLKYGKRLEVGYYHSFTEDSICKHQGETVKALPLIQHHWMHCCFERLQVTFLHHENI